MASSEILSQLNLQRGIFPIAEWFSGYRKQWLQPDILAGVTTAAVVIPKAMAYATIAGLPVQVGLYTAFIPMVIYAVLGTSCVLSVSTSTTLAILTAAELAEVVPSGDPAALLTATATLTALVGGILIVASILRLGFVANFISEPVLVGFKAGIGVVIVVDQVPKILGVHIARGSFLQNVVTTIQSLPKTSLTTLALGLSMIAILFVFERFWPKAPAPILAVAAGTVAAYFLNLHAHGVELVGHIAQGIPSVIAPDRSLLTRLWPGALGIALMSFTETVAAGRAFARSDEPPLLANRELLATGMANVGGAFLGAMPAGGGTTQTAVNRLAGARTQMAELVTAAIALLTMLLVAPLLGNMPQATLAAVVIVYSFGLIQPIEFRDILSIRRTEFVWAVVAFTGVMLLGTLKGIVVAIIVSLVTLAYHVADPPVYVLRRKPGTNVFRPQSAEHPEDETFPALLLLRLVGPIFFINAAQIAHKIEPLVAQAQPRVVAVDLSGVLDLEYTALKMFVEATRRQRDSGVQVWLAGMNPGVLAVVQKSPLGDMLGRQGMHFNLEIAVATYLSAEAASGNSA
jgi:high affinity sulfate transporter 1